MDHVGAKCFECKRQDFLPFQCKHCGMQFCIEHRYPDQHGCCSVTNQKCRKVIKKKSPPTNYKTCTECNKPVLLIIKCPTCDKNFCLKHRNSLDHTCKKKPTKPEKAKCLSFFQKIFIFR